jgi:hypothetical protein
MHGIISIILVSLFENKEKVNPPPFGETTIFAV